MIKIFEPFQSKIQLHIDEDFLQSLWDKYVPASSESYERISLIYLNGAAAADKEPPQPIQVLVNMALKNISFRMNMKQNQMLVSRQALDRSLKCSMKYYLEQLRRSDFQVYQSVNQYVTYLEREEDENKRYRSWQKEAGIIEQLKNEHRVLQNFSLQINELLTDQSAQAKRQVCKDMFQSLGKKEYKILAESFIWQEKEQLESYIRFISEGQYQEILKRLVKVKELHDILTAEITSVQKAENVTDTEHILESISREQLIQSLEVLEQKDFRKFYQKVVFYGKRPGKDEKQLFRTGVIWQRMKKEMIWQLNQLNEESMHHFWKQLSVFSADVCRMEEARLKESQTELQKEKRWIHYHVCQRFSVSLEEAQEKYFSEIRESLHNQALGTLKQEEYSIISKAVDLPQFLNNIEQIQENLEERLEEQKNRITERETKALESYQDILHTDNFIVSRQTEIDQGSTEFGTMMEWSEALLVHPERGQQDEDAAVSKNAQQEIAEPFAQETQAEIIRRQTKIAKDRAEFDRRQTETAKDRAEFDQSQIKTIKNRTEIEKLIEWSEALLVHPKRGRQEGDTAYIEEWPKETGEPMKGETQAEIIRRQIETAKDRAKLQRLVERISHHIKEDMKEETFRLEYQESQLKNPSIRKLIGHIRQLDEAQYRIFVRELSDLTLLQWRRMGVVYQEETQTEIVRHEIEAIKDRREFQKLREWSKALLVHPKHGRQKEDTAYIEEWPKETGEPIKEETQAEIIRRQIETAKDRAELQRLVERISHHIKEDMKEGTFRLEYQESQLKNPSIRKLIGHIRQLDKEQYQTFVKELAETAVMEWQKTKEVYNRDTRTEVNHSKTEAIKDRVEIEKLMEWGEALLVHPKRVLQKEDTAQIGGRPREAGEPIMKETQAEIIRRQIETAKDRAELQRLVERISHYIKEDTKEETFRLEYQESQLKNPSIRKLIGHIRQLDGEQYRIFVRELSSSALLKWRRMGVVYQQETEAEEINEHQPEAIKDRAKLQELREWNQSLLVHPKRRRQEEDADYIGEQAKERTELLHLMEQINRNVKGDTVRLEYRESQLHNKSIQKLIRHIRRLDEVEYQRFVRRLSDLILLQQQRTQKLPWKETQTDQMYTELADRIQNYEERRLKRYKSKVRQFEAKYSVSDSILFHRQNTRNSELLKETVSRQNYREYLKHQDYRGYQIYQGYQYNRNLQHTVIDETPLNRLTKSDIRMREETIQMKSVQDQLNTRLKEVEKQLRKAEDKASAKEDVRAVAEKVKKQLHEELHMERLRRGMV